MVTHPFSNPVEQDLTSKNKQWWFFWPGQSQGHWDSILFNACTEVPHPKDKSHPNSSLLKASSFYQSLDYDTPENTLYFKEQKSYTAEVGTSE